MARAVLAAVFATVAFGAGLTGLILGGYAWGPLAAKAALLSLLCTPCKE